MALNNNEIENIGRRAAQDMLGWIEGIGTMAATEPTNVCDVARTFSYIRIETPALQQIEGFLRKYNLAPQGTYDEDGHWSPPCPVRRRCAYGGSFLTPEEIDNDQALQILTWNLFDAHIEYRRCCPEISEELKELHDVLEEERK